MRPALTLLLLLAACSDDAASTTDAADSTSLAEVAVMREGGAGGDAYEADIGAGAGGAADEVDEVDVGAGRGQPGAGVFEAGEELARALGRDVDEAGEAVDEGGEAGGAVDRCEQALAEGRGWRLQREGGGEGGEGFAGGAACGATDDGEGSDDRGAGGGRDGRHRRCTPGDGPGTGAAASRGVVDRGGSRRDAPHRLEGPARSAGGEGRAVTRGAR